MKSGSSFEHADAMDAALSSLAGAPPRLWQGDATLFSSDPGDAASIANRLGWLRAPAAFRDRVGELDGFTRGLRAAGFDRALLFGMGGSSLCPEVLATILGTSNGALDLRVLDSTDPDAVLHATEWADIESTLFVVASKSGTTVEVASFEAHFWELAKARFRDAAGARFIAITDPGTRLAEQSRARGYRRTFENPADIGGRYSAISWFGLVPAALIGADVRALVASAVHMGDSCGPDRSADANPGVVLGAFVGGLARAGRNKLTLIASPSVRRLGSWIEQLVAESTGKRGQGVVPVDLEPVGEPSAYGDDRAFVYLRADASLDGAIDALLRAGHPVARIEVDPKELGAEFFRWEVATAIAAAVLGVNPFDEPNVTEAKRETAALLEEHAREGRLRDFPGVDPNDGAIGALLRKVGAGDYITLSAYFERTKARDEILERIRARLRQRTRAATTLGYGPRFLHSTGQLHKGGPPSGVFVVLTADATHAVPIPEAAYDFGTLLAAQAIGDLEVLERRNRRLIRVHLGADPDGGLEALARTLDS